ncbi:MAG TPA: tetratricopeptide repeat protein [Psychromonas hadalis]|nr:tetratricopeptide repeat protein [Psychromonas hadalis]
MNIEQDQVNENLSSETPIALPNVLEANAGDRIDGAFDFIGSSLVEAALAVEAEMTTISRDEFYSALRLQKIVLSSKLSTHSNNNKEKLQHLLQIIYQEQDFKMNWKAAFVSKNTLISKVLSRREGIPLTLGILLLDQLKECGFDANGICFPSGFLIQVNLETELLYVDPMSGELPSWDNLSLRIRGHLGNHKQLTLDMLKISSNQTIICHLLNVMKAVFLQEDKLELALLCCDILLRIEPDNAYEIRDRGFLFQQLDCTSVACDDFNHFIDKHPEDPMVNVLREQIEEMKKIKPVLH